MNKKGDIIRTFNKDPKGPILLILVGKEQDGYWRGYDKDDPYKVPLWRLPHSEQAIWEVNLRNPTVKVLYGDNYDY